MCEQCQTDTLGKGIATTDSTTLVRIIIITLQILDALLAGSLLCLVWFSGDHLRFRLFNGLLSSRAKPKKDSL